MKVVIVAKTRMGSGACIGGITFEGRSVRLIASDAEWNDQFNMEYNVGEVWDVDYEPVETLVPPHIENILVQGKQLQPPIDDIVAFIEHHMPPKEGGVDVLYEGLTQATPSGALYITEQSGVPPYSTMFWRPDKPLVRDDEGKRIRYCYPLGNRSCTLTFVGFQEPIPEIPAGSLLRVSLAHWWRPRETPDGELRCYVQLSGWFLPGLHFNGGEAYILEDEEILFSLPEIAMETGPYDDLHSALKKVFGFNEFRPLQEGIIQNVLAKKDSLAIMPTGSGKSLSYQLPALLFPGLTVVVSPLISLMEDQVMQLRELGISALFLNSTLSYKAYLKATQRVRAGQVKLLYAAPETLLRPETLVLLEQCHVDCLTIDEAHCISEWGHDFRPEYRQLMEVQRRLPDAVCLALTATATERVQQDIKDNLGIRNADVFVATLNRDNLLLAVEPKTDLLSQTVAFLNEHKGESGIIYCATRRQVDDLTDELAARGFSVLPYHAGLDDDVRRQNQRQFIYDEVPIVVATVAFGMGINKSNVRFILHVDLPKDLESYYQQIGRAGRDGLPSDCLLLYSFGDVHTINYFIRQQARDQQRGAQVRLEAMRDFATTGLCRRKSLLAYFGESYDGDNCERCDNCTNKNEEALSDLTIPAQKFLSCVKRTGEFFGASHIIDVLRGSRSEKVLSRGHDRLSTYDIGREFSKKQWQHLVQQFIQQGLLIRSMPHGSLKLTQKGVAVLKGEPVYGLLPPKTKVATPTTPASRQANYDVVLFEQLRAKRKALADEARVPAHMIFSDQSLVEMATYFPQSRATFASILGVGAAKLVKFADAFLPIIQAYCREHGIEEVSTSNVPSDSLERLRPRRRASGPKEHRSNRTDEVLTLYNQNHSITEIAQRFNLKPSTITRHLYKAAQQGHVVRPETLLKESWLTPDEQQTVFSAFNELGTQWLRPVYEALNETVSYDELHILRLYYMVQKQQN